MCPPKPKIPKVEPPAQPAAPATPGASELKIGGSATSSRTGVLGRLRLTRNKAKK